MEEEQPFELEFRQQQRKFPGPAEQKSDLTGEIFALSQQMKMFERHLEENDSELCKVKQEQDKLKALVDEHTKRLSLLDEEVLLDNNGSSGVDMTAPSVNRFRINHERLVEAQNEQFSKLAVLREQSKITLVHPNEPITTMDFTFNSNSSSTEPTSCPPKVNGRKSVELSDCSATVLGEIKGHMAAMAEENNQCISRAVDALHGSFSTETSIIHDHLESFDDHLEAVERRMQSSDSILQEHVSDLTALRERLEEIADKCNGNPASTDTETQAINDEFKALLDERLRTGSWEIVQLGERSRANTTISERQMSSMTEPSTHDLHFRELEKQFQLNWKKLNEARTAQNSELVAFQGRLNATGLVDPDHRTKSLSQPDATSFSSMLSYLQVGKVEDALAHSLPTRRDLEEMVQQGGSKMPRADDLEGLQCQFSAELKALERCVEENDEKLNNIQTTMLQGRLEAVEALEDHLKAVEDRLDRTDEKLNTTSFESANAQLKALERRVMESDGRIGRLLKCQLSASTVLREKLNAMREEYSEHPQMDNGKKMDVPKKTVEFNGHPKVKLDSPFVDNEQNVPGSENIKRDGIVVAEPAVLDERLTSLEGQLEGMMMMLLHA